MICHHASIAFTIWTVSITGNVMKIGNIVMIMCLTGSRSGSHNHDHPASQRTTGAAAMTLNIGDRVRMTNCIEADMHPDKLWTVRSEPWELGDGTQVVLLEGKSGGFCCGCLEKVIE